MPAIADVARLISDRNSVTHDEALTLATALAIQLGYSAPENGQAPGLRVSDADAGHILGAGAAEIELERGRL